MALAANKAIGDILSIIGRSPIVLEEVFDAVLANALQLCDGELAVLHLYDKELGFRFVRAKNVPAEFENWLTAAGNYKANPETGLGRIELLKQPVNIVDIRSEDIYEKGDPLRVATADLGGARSFVACPMLAGDELVPTRTVGGCSVPFECAKQQMPSLNNLDVGTAHWRRCHRFSLSADWALLV